MKWSGDAPPTRSQVAERISELDVERKRLDAYLKALDGLAEPIAAEKSVSVAVSISGVEAIMRPSNPSANATADVARQILLRNGGPMMLEAMLPHARAVKSWKASGDDKKDKGRLYSAMHRANEVFLKTPNGWALLE